VGTRAGLETEARRKILCPCRGSNPDRPVVQPVVRTILPELARLPSKICTYVISTDKHLVKGYLLSISYTAIKVEMSLICIAYKQISKVFMIEKQSVLHDKGGRPPGQVMFISQKMSLG
jgi:hypothetical protein